MEGKPVAFAPRAGIFQRLQLPRRRAGGSQRIPRCRDGGPGWSPAGSEACAELPGWLRGAPGTPSRLQGKPRGSRGVFGNSAAANHPTRQESSGFGLVPIQDFFNGHFPPPSLSFQVQSFFSPHSSILRILRQLESLPKARRGKPITLLQKSACLAWIVQPKEEI